MQKPAYDYKVTLTPCRKWVPTYQMDIVFKKSYNLPSLVTYCVGAEEAAIEGAAWGAINAMDIDTDLLVEDKFLWRLEDGTDDRTESGGDGKGSGDYPGRIGSDCGRN